MAVELPSYEKDDLWDTKGEVVYLAHSVEGLLEGEIDLFDGSIAVALAEEKAALVDLRIITKPGSFGLHSLLPVVVFAAHFGLGLCQRGFDRAAWARTMAELANNWRRLIPAVSIRLLICLRRSMTRLLDNQTATVSAERF